MTTFNMSKIVEMFRNLKSDAMPRPPRSAANVNNVPEQPQVIIEDVDDEEIIIEPEDDIKRKPRKKSSKPKNVVDDDDDDVEEVIKPKKKQDGGSSVNVQATGNVYNIVNSSKVRLGDDYYFGLGSTPSKNKFGDHFEEQIEKDNLITLLMEAQTKPHHDYLSYISKNLGKNWQTFFRSLGFTQGKIETAELNAAGYDISEARYKLLLEWVNNDDDGTLGRLTTLLWEEGERSIVKALSAMYKKSKSKK